MTSLKVLFIALVVLGIASAVLINEQKVYTTHPCNFKESCGIHDYKRVGRSQDDAHTISIWTRQNNFADSCPGILMDVSDPESENYGKHLTFEQIRELVYDEEAIAAIQAHLDKFDIPAESREVAPNGEFIRVTAPRSTIERIFNTEYHEFRSVERMATLHRAESYTLAPEIAQYVKIVRGINDFPMHHIKTGFVSYQKRQQGPSVTPKLIASTYRMPNQTDSSPKSDMSVFESLGQSYSPSDLEQFQKMFNLPIQKVKQVKGQNNGEECSYNPNNCAEANLDVQYIMAMAQNAPLTYWSIPASVGSIFEEFAEELAKDPNAPLVHSISYGGSESMQNKQNMRAFNDELCKLGVRGLTVFVASGDDGAAGSGARGNPSGCGLNPDYPANCPYITTVGATMGPESGNPEVVCQSDAGSIITSGGGFSDFFSQPSYQSDAVSSYLRTGTKVPPQNLFNTQGRAYPDVAALGNAYVVVIGGQSYQLSGTSASTPVFCAMVALVNGDREVRNKSPLGFLNPVLYKVDKSVFNDITQGENNCAAGQGNPVCCQNGFSAGKGWDPVSGWGSLDFKLFADALANL